MAPNTFSTLQGAHNFSIHEATVNNVQGNYIVNHMGFKDERRDFLDFHSRLSQNFNHEPYYASRHKQHLGKTAEGTCRWVFEDSTFREWRDEALVGNPVLWTHGPPGSGKSILCSQVIQDLEQAPNKPTLAYHFCDFARQHKEIEILSMLACQLLDVDSGTFSDLPPLPLSIISAAALQLRKPEYVRNIIKHLVARSSSSIVYFLLDGLDEELVSPTRWGEGVGAVLKFVIQMAVELPQHVRVWVSSQKRAEIQAALQKHSEVDLAPFARRDILTFLSKSVPQIKGPGKQDQDMILENLEGGAETSFIWATLMLDELKKLPSLSAIKSFVQEGFPSSLNEYYARIFDGFAPHLRPLASEVFSLIVYAKRPLRFCELWDALWALSNKGHRVFDPETKPYKDHLMEVFQPFIELVPIPGHENPTKDGKDPEDQHICRLIHSTVRDFFFSHRMVMCPSPSDNHRVYICPETPFTACLTYLSQSRFAALLTKQDGHWVDSSGTPVMEGRFLIYASKYWDKHLDSIGDGMRQNALLPLVITFVKSPNFWTIAQVQSIWVQFQFSKMSVISGGEVLPTHVRRVFPMWFMHSDEGFKLWIQYRSFLRQWRYLLCLGEHDDQPGDQWTRASYVGELHHIWTGALGHNHFLKDKQSSMTTFPISVDRSRVQRQQPATCIYFTNLVDNAGDFMYSLRIYITDLPIDQTDEPPTLESVMGSAMLECLVEAWKLVDNAEPVLHQSQTLCLPANTFDLDLYISNPTNPYTRCDRASLAAFASNGKVMRIGSRVFMKTETGSFRPVVGLHTGATNRKLRYIEEIATHGSFLITASRTKISDKDLDAGLDYLHEDSDSDGIDVVDSDDDGYADADHIVCLDSDEEEVRHAGQNDSDMEYASEDDSVSEGSSEFSDDERFQDVLVNPGGDAQYYYSDDSEDEDRGYAGGASRYWRSAPDGGLVVDSDSDSSDSEEGEDINKGQAPGNGLTREDDEDNWDDLPRYFGSHTLCHSKPRATITIWSVGATPVRVFKKEVPIRCKVYCSPPAFHPTQPLAVWPLGDGDILFVDYQAKRSFTLSLRPSTTLVPSRFISIQCVFSSCGQYVHIAALEGFRPDPKALATAKQDGSPLPPLHVALLLATYRLSTKKTTRSPPKLIHVVRVDLKEVKGIDTKQLPFSFTWTEERLYLTASWKMLHVGRIHLFRQDDRKDTKEAEDLDDDEYAEDSQPVLAPEKVVFLPYTCKHRSVQFFPSKPSESTSECPTGSQRPAKVIIGYDASVLAVPTSKPRTEHSCDTLQLLGVEVFRPTLSFEDPIICYLDEKKDLGEWIDSKARAKITKGSGSGQLYKRMDGAEMFNPEDDCDLEPYYF